MSNWGSAPVPMRSSGLFIKLGDGESVEFVPLGNVRVKFRRWNGAAYETETGPGKGITVQYVANVFDVGEQAVRILTLSATAYDMLKDEINDDGVVNVFRLARKGTGTSTEYRVKTIAAKAGEAKQIVTAEDDESNMHDLHESYDPSEVDWTGTGTGTAMGSDPERPATLDYSGADDDIPF